MNDFTCLIGAVIIMPYLQLSISMKHSCLSIGKYCRSMGQEAVIVSLKVLHLLVNLLVAHVTHEKKSITGKRTTFVGRTFDE